MFICPLRNPKSFCLLISILNLLVLLNYALQLIPVCFYFSSYLLARVRNELQLCSSRITCWIIHTGFLLILLLNILNFLELCYFLGVLSICSACLVDLYGCWQVLQNWGWKPYFVCNKIPKAVGKTLSVLQKPFFSFCPCI